MTWRISGTKEKKNTWDQWEQKCPVFVIRELKLAGVRVGIFSPSSVSGQWELEIPVGGYWEIKMAGVA